MCSTGSADLSDWQQFEVWTGAGVQQKHTIPATPGQGQERTTGKPGPVSLYVH